MLLFLLIYENSIKQQQIGRHFAHSTPPPNIACLKQTNKRKWNGVWSFIFYFFSFKIKFSSKFDSPNVRLCLSVCLYSIHNLLIWTLNYKLWTTATSLKSFILLFPFNLMYFCYFAKKKPNQTDQLARHFQRIIKIQKKK